MTEGGICLGCVSGAIHDGSPKGEVSKVAGLDTYIAQPASPENKKAGLIVIIPDIFGWELVNLQLLADDYAERSGRTVYLPDFMFGHSLSLGDER
jgi:dienelactone hydrolase